MAVTGVTGGVAVARGGMVSEPETSTEGATMRDATLRAQKDRVLEPVVQRLFASVHPNVVSIVAMLVGVAAALAVVGHMYLLGLALWLLNRVLDGIDGLIARVHEKQSDFGGYLDLLLDYVVYLAIPIAFMAANPTTVVLWSGILLLAVYVLNLLSWTMLAALLEKRNLQSRSRLTSMEMPVGLVEGAETILFYVMFFLLPSAVAQIFAVMSVLVLFTAGQRVVWAYRFLR